MENCLTNLADATRTAAAPTPVNGVPPAKSFDLALALHRVDGDAELLRDLIGLFLDDYPQQLAAL